MANLQEVVSWEAGIYQLETGDPVLGGPGGISNKQGQALANRTAYLKKHMDDLEVGNTAAGKANKLSTARTIALAGDVTGQASFDGSGNISITATYKNSGVVAGTYRSVTVDAKGNITAGTNPTTLAGYGITDALPATGTAEAAKKLATARTIALTGDVTGQADFDGSGNISITTTYKNSGVTAGTYRSVTVDAKGNITAGTNPTTLAGYGITDAATKTELGTVQTGLNNLGDGTTPAGKADKLSTARTIALAGDVTGQAAFDGSGNISITTTYKNSGVTAGTYRSVTVDAKGNITGGTNPTTLAGYGITDAVSSTQYATEALKGIASVATQAEVNAGTDDTKFVTAKKLMAWVKQASETVLGMMKVATQVQTDAGVADDVAVTPKKLRAGFAISIATNGYVALPSWMGGLIIQWGSITPAGGNGTAPLPITFVTDSFCIVGQLGTGGIAEFGLVNIYTEGLSTVRAITRNHSGGLTPLQVRYIAIGK